MHPPLIHPNRDILRARALQRRVLASCVMASIRAKDIAEFILERAAEGVGANTIRLDLALLSRLFEMAVRNWGNAGRRRPLNAWKGG